MEAELRRFSVEDPLHGAVPCAALLPPGERSALPLCLFLFGGGGSVESLAAIAPCLQGLWRSAQLPPLVLATPGVDPFGFYLEDPARGYGWESFICRRFVPQLRAALPLDAARATLLGVSMGGYGALKLAFAERALFGAVAAISPMLEPSLEAEPVRPRNRYFYTPDMPQALLGPARDPELYRTDHPACRARRHAEALRAGEVAIYIDAAGTDALHAHDGAEHLHRLLWELDVAHEYRLRRDSDHTGPDLLERLRDGLSWLMARVRPQPQAALSELDLAWQTYLEQPRDAPPQTPPDPSSPVFSRWLRAQLAPLRAAAEREDASVARRYGPL